VRSLALGCLLAFVGCLPQITPIDRPMPEDENMADTTLTDTPGWESLNVPTPGDPIRAAVAPGAVRPGYQKLANRTAALAYGYHSKPIRHRTADTSPATTITVDSMGWIGLTKGGGVTWELLNHSAPSNLNIVALAGALGLATRYYIYAYDNAGAVAFAINTTAPTSEGLYKTGSTDYFYVGTFSTDHLLGAPNEYFADNGEYIYTLSPDQTVLTGGVALVQTAVDMESATARLVPSYATRVLLQARTLTTVPPGEATLYPNAIMYNVAQLIVDNVYATTHLLLPSVAGKIDYMVNAATTSLTLDVKGFHEPRK